MPTYFAANPGDCCKAFAASYDLANLPAMLEIERAVLGCDYGGTSWTTRDQAGGIVAALGLAEDMHVLDIGSGSGWPALFLAAESGCRVTLVDLPKNALAMARRRARSDGLADRVSAVAASGHALPFASATFAAITHSDVLCCLPQKREMLAECRRVAADDCRMDFSVIAVAPGLAAERRQQAIDAGPPFVDAPGDYAALLAESGWRVLQCGDCSDEHRESLRRLVAAMGASAGLADALGAAAVDEAIAHRQRQIAAIEAGLLVRQHFLVAADRGPHAALPVERHRHRA